MAPKDFGEKERKTTAAKRSSVAAGNDAAFRGYINLSLTSGEKDSYDTWATCETVMEIFGLAVADGVNIACKPDPKGQGFLASATQRREASPNAGLCVTARANEPAKALGRLMYCLGILARQEKWEDTQPVSDPDRW